MRGTPGSSCPRRNRMIVRLVFVSLLLLVEAGTAAAQLPATYAELSVLSDGGDIKTRLQENTGVTALYLLICVGFLRVLGRDGLREAGEAGTATAGILAGAPGRIAITTLIAIALLASLNGTVLGGARIAYAMAQRGAMWPLMGTVDETRRVPQRALWLQSVLACLLVLSGKFEQLSTMVSLAMVVTGTLTVASVFVLRRTSPETPRP